jgi:hypothetical protein
MSELIFQVSLEDASGGAPKAVHKFQVRIQEGISLKLAKAIALELLPKKLLAAIDKALVEAYEAQTKGAALVAAAKGK